MTSISAPIATLVTQAPSSASPQASQPVASQSNSSASTFGDAVSVSLSAPAQAVVNNQSASSSTPPANSPNTTPTSQAPVAPPSPPVVNVAALISASKQKIIPQVGVSGASDVVDSKGNISKVQLAIEIAEQAQKA